MIKPSNKPREFEKVEIDVWINGEIVDIKDDPERKTNFTDEDGKPKVVHGIQFVFKLEGYSFSHYSRWYTLSYSEKANLYKEVLVHLVDNCHEYMDFDLETLKGLKVKTMWNESKGKDGRIWQNLTQIRALGTKPKGEAVRTESEDVGDEPPTEEVPF
jgi:hypothetical protein